MEACLHHIFLAMPDPVLCMKGFIGVRVDFHSSFAMIPKRDCLNGEKKAQGVVREQIYVLVVRLFKKTRTRKKSGGIQLHAHVFSSNTNSLSGFPPLPMPHVVPDARFGLDWHPAALLKSTNVVRIRIRPSLV